MTGGVKTPVVPMRADLPAFCGLIGVKRTIPAFLGFTCTLITPFAFEGLVRMFGPGPVIRMRMPLAALPFWSMRRVIVAPQVDEARAGGSAW